MDVCIWEVFCVEKIPLCVVELELSEGKGAAYFDLKNYMSRMRALEMRESTNNEASFVIPFDYGKYYILL
jgi:hypothetical protein